MSLWSVLAVAVLVVVVVVGQAFDKYGCCLLVDLTCPNHSVGCSYLQESIQSLRIVDLIIIFIYSWYICAHTPLAKGVVLATTKCHVWLCYVWIKKKKSSLKSKLLLNCIKEAITKKKQKWILFSSMTRRVNKYKLFICFCLGFHLCILAKNRYIYRER